MAWPQAPRRAEVGLIGAVVIVAFVTAASHASAQPAAPADTGIIRGIVVDTRGGTPIHRVSVRLQSTGQTTVTDEQGRFQFAGVAAGDQELYVSAVDFILVKRSVPVTPGATTEVTIALAEGSGTYKETVTVVGAAPVREDPAVAAEHTLRRTVLQQLGSLVNDPLRAIQALPGVAATDDFRGEFAIRGAGVQQMNFTFEGISTPFLLHTIQQVHDAGSIAMVSSDVLEEVLVSNGAYPQRYGNRTVAEVNFRMREGSRERIKSHVATSLMDTSAVVEGPFGSASRGSWLFAVRKSYFDLVVVRLYPDKGLTFGFTDAQAKLTYDLNPRHQLQFALTAGDSRFERTAVDLLSPGNLRDGRNKSGIAVMSWRYLPSSRFELTQRVAVTANTYRNTARDGPDLDSGSARDVLYRADWSYRPRPGLTVEGGGEARRSAAAGREQRFSGNRLQLRESYNASALAPSAYVQARLAAANGATIVSGLRGDHWSLTDDTTASPWIEGAWPITRSLTLRAGSGIYRHEPGFGEALGFRGSSALRAERAYHADAGLEGRVGPTLRWQTTVYDREDRDLLRLPDSELRLVKGALQLASVTSRYQTRSTATRAASSG
jgi:hypothetical protein